LAAKETARLQMLVNEKTKQVTEIQKSLSADRDKMVKQRDELQKTLKQLKSPLAFLSNNRAWINRDMGQAIAVLPGVMYLTSISDSGDLITLEGLSPDTDTVISYARSLRQTGLFRLVTVTNINNQSYNDVLFTMVLYTTSK
jgi:Tfp pilus assembly protein PilN